MVWQKRTNYTETVFLKGGAPPRERTSKSSSTVWRATVWFQKRSTNHFVIVFKNKTQKRMVCDMFFLGGGCCARTHLQPREDLLAIRCQNDLLLREADESQVFTLNRTIPAVISMAGVQGGKSTLLFARPTRQEKEGGRGATYPVGGGIG